MYNSNDFEAEFCQKAWQIISDISEQLSHNQKFAASLLNQAHKLKDEAAEAKTGFSLRRFNVDITEERLESELERVNAHLLVENQSLSHENKQLSFLLKEYEQTVENIMNKLRAHSVSSSVYEAELMRYYESRLSQDIITPYSVDHPQTSQHLQRLVRGLHAVLAFMDGKTPADLPEDFNAEDFVHSYADPSAPLQPSAIEIPEVISIPSPREHHESAPTYPPPLYPETPSTASSSSASSSSESPSPPPSESHHPEPSSQAAHVPSGSEPKAQTADSARLEDLSWAEAREVEIERLAAENACMRQLLGIDDESMTTAGLPLTVEFPPTVLPLEAPPPAPTPAPPPSSRRPRLSGGMFVPAAWHQAQQEQAQGGWTAPPGAQQRLAMPMGGGGGQQFPAQGQMQQPLPQQFQQGPPLQSLAQHQWTNNFSGRGGLFAGGLMGGAPSRGGVGSFRGRGAWTVG